MSATIAPSSQIPSITVINMAQQRQCQNNAMELQKSAQNQYFPDSKNNRVVIISNTENEPAKGSRTGRALAGLFVGGIFTASTFYILLRAANFVCKHVFKHKASDRSILAASYLLGLAGGALFGLQQAAMTDKSETRVFSHNSSSIIIR